MAVALARQLVLTLLALARLARQLKPLDFPESLMQYRSIALLALARQLTLLALARLARQLKSLDFSHAIPVNNIASANSSANTASAGSASSSVKPLTLPQ